MAPTVNFRREVRPGDSEIVRAIVESSGFFHDYEVDVAEELVVERLKTGISSGYYFIFVEVDGRTVGYSCFGKVPCTKDSFDLYWIAIHQENRGGGLGYQLLMETERDIQSLDGRRIWVETSSLDKYLPTRQFYDRCGYSVAAQLHDFYEAGDNKVIFVKLI